MKEAKNELMQFVAGIIMLVVGLYIFSQKVIVFSGFFSFGGGRFSSGLIVVPLIIGIVWMFVSGANFASKVFTVLAAIIIIASVVMTTNIHLSAMTLYDWILILVLIFGGAGLVGKVLFAGNFSDDKGRKGGNKKADDVSSRSVRSNVRSVTVIRYRASAFLTRIELLPSTSIQ